MQSRYDLAPNSFVLKKALTRKKEFSVQYSKQQQQQVNSFDGEA